MKQKKLVAAILCAVAPLAYADSDDTPLEIRVVTGTRIEQPLQKSLSHTTVITHQDIEQSQAVDVPSVLRNLAGVEFYQSGGVGKQSSLFLRGTNSSHVLILLDGVRINSATTGATAIDQLMLDQVDHIEVVRGNASSLYGSEAIGGVIQIFTRQGRGEPALNASTGIGSHNTQRAAAGFGGEVDNTAFNVQVSRFRTDGISAINPSIVPTVNPDSDGYDNTSLSGSVRHQFSADNSLAASVFQSQGNVQFDNAFGLPTDINTSKATLSKFSLISENRLSDSWQSKLQLAQGVDETLNYLNGMPDVGLGAQFKTTSNQVTWQNTVQISHDDVVLIGLENLNQQVASDTAYTKTARKVDALFAGYTGNYGAHQIQANIRQDRYSDFGNANTGLLGYGYALSDAWRATASISTAFKAPTFNDLYGPPGFGSNPGLRPERSFNNEIGLHFSAREQHVDAVYFDNRIRDLIAADNTFTLQNLKTARSNGIEISYAGQFGDTGVKAALTAQDPRDTQTGLALLRRARSFADMGVTQRLGGWKVGGEWQYSGTREDIDINTFARTTLDSYSVVNLTASHDLSRQLKLSLRAENLFNRDYVLAHGYNTLGRTLFVHMSYQQ